MQHLKLVEGYSYERICEILKENGLETGAPNYEPYKGQHFFRDSRIHLKDHKSLEKALEILGNPENTKHFKYYHGLYQPDKDFDYSSLTGSIWFSNGRLVERIAVGLKIGLK
ncbi:MAG: hypothetical protein WC867_03630 [Candidatus Pacearchaeota archaeon]